MRSRRPYRRATREKYLRKRGKKFRESAMHVRKQIHQDPSEKTPAVLVSTTPINANAFTQEWYGREADDDHE